MSNILNKILENELINYIEDNNSDWREAVNLSCHKLLENGYISDLYPEEIIQSVEEHGPYIVIVDNVAIPHAQENSKGVIKTGVAFTKFENHVEFVDLDNDQVKYAKLFFTLASNNPDEHLKNIQDLVMVLSDEAFLQALDDASSLKDIEDLFGEYGD